MEHISSPLARLLKDARAKMDLKTTFEYPPIPIRNLDWSAIDNSTYDGPGSPIGTGATEAEAILDLLEQIEARE